MKRINITFVFSLLSLTLILLIGCDNSKKWEKEEKRQIQQYINSLGDTVAVLKPSGLYYIEIQEGTGRTPVDKDTVYIWFEATHLDGTLLTSNLDQASPYPFIVGYGPIEGLDEGVRYMKDGGKAKLLTPSSLAYGSYGISGYLSGYTPLLWNIELAGVLHGSKK
jgi:FKBP-type peptidyl-prolyl cis-trans isomerase